MRCLLALLLAPALLWGQDVDLDDIKPEPSWKPATLETPKDIKDKKKATSYLKAFKRDFKSKDKKLRIAAMDTLLKQGRHETFVSAFASALKDRSPLVREAAARNLARLGYRKGAPYLATAFGSPQNRKHDAVRVASLDALGRIDQKKSYFKKYRKVFEKDCGFDIRAAALLFGHARDRQALRLLGRWLETPSPTDPNSASNPPASYWEKKHELWLNSRQAIEWAVWSITGELLETPSEVSDWIIEDEKRRKKSKKKKSKLKVRR